LALSSRLIRRATTTFVPCAAARDPSIRSLRSLPLGKLGTRLGKFGTRLGTFARIS